MKYDEIKRSFINSSQLIEKCDNFRHRNVERFLKRSLTTSIDVKTFLHVFPLDFLGTNVDITVNSVAHPRFDSQVENFRFNISGCGADFQLGSAKCHGQFFRNGSVEFAMINGPFMETRGGDRILRGSWFKKTIIDFLYSVKRVYDEWELLDAPVVIYLSILNASGTVLRLKSHELTQPLNEDYAVLPEVISTFDEEDVEVLANKLLDVFWQGYGRPPGYDVD